MKLTVLGNTGPYPAAGGACSGYLLENGSSKIVLDMGNGVLSNLLRICKIEDISAIVLSHLHPDHISDLFVLRYALEFKGLTVPLYAPSQPEEEFARLAYKDVFDIQVLCDNTVIEADGMTLTFREMQHPYQDFAVKAVGEGGTFMYTGDTAMCDNLTDFAQGVNVLLCDSAFLDNVDSNIHLSMQKAIDLANTIAARRLILTHFNPEINPQRYYEIGNGRFNGRLSKAEIMASFTI